MRLTSETCLPADPWVVRSIPAWSHTFVAIDREIISTAILLPSYDSRMVVISYKGKYVHKVLVNPPPPQKKKEINKKCG